jgi:DNA polymerase IV
MTPPRRILLADCDAYFVQVARLEDPRGAGRERLLLVGGSPEGRGVVTSASYEVREYGVRSGMSMAQALRLCPQAKWAPVPRGACSRIHGEIRTVLDRFVPVVESASIDEFYLDLSGTETLYHQRALADVAEQIRTTVLAETNINISIGGGTNRLIAKLAARKAKPAGVHVVEAGEELAFMRTLPLSAIPGIGPRLQEKLRTYGLTMIADMLPLEKEVIASWFPGGLGDWLFDRIRGIAGARVSAHSGQKSMSRDETFGHDINDDEELGTELLELVVRAGHDLRADGLRARTITVRIRDADFTTRQASHTLREPVESDRVIHGVTVKLLARLRLQRRTSARLLGVSLSNLVAAAESVQLALFELGEKLETDRDRQVARVLDNVRDRFGSRALRPGRITRPQ